MSQGWILNQRGGDVPRVAGTMASWSRKEKGLGAADLNQRSKGTGRPFSALIPDKEISCLGGER